MRTPGQVLLGTACVWSLVLCGPATSPYCRRLHREPGRRWSDQRDGDGICARRPAVRLPAGRAAARHQGRPAVAGAVRLVDGECQRRARPARHRVRSGVRLDQFVYMYYTATSPQVHNRVSRFTANGDVVVPGSEVPILDLEPLSGATNHNGGAIHFGIDGKLYVAVGENANAANSQTLANRLGKILGSIRTARFRHTTRFSARPPASIARFGRWACAIRSRLRYSRGRADLHQRRGTGRVGGNQRRRRRSQLRLARMRRAQRDRQQYSVLRCVTRLRSTPTIVCRLPRAP